MITAAITPDQDAIVGEVFIAAPPARVFQAITDPRQMPLWWGQKDMYHITEWKADLRLGGKWSSVGVSTDGKPFRIDGEYLEVDPPRLLVHTWISSYGGPRKTVVRWELEPHVVQDMHPSAPRKSVTGTLVKIHHSGFAGDPEAAKSHNQGWQRVLAWMQAFVEKGATVDTRG